MNDKHTLKDSIFKIGKVISVKGRAVDIKVDKTKNTSHLLYKGELLKNISVGGYVKIIKGFTKIVGKVEGEYINEDKYFSKKEYGSGKEKISRVLNISLLGFFSEKGFERGIKELPLIDNECFLLENSEFNEVHDFLKKGDEPITIGTLSLEKGQEIKVGIDSLFASHVGIFGNTGSGKSYTLAKIYRELFKQYKDQKKFKKNAHFFLIDFNGEYIGDDVIIEKSYKNIYKLSTDENGSANKFPITKNAIQDPAFWIVFLTATEKTQSPFLKNALEGGYISKIFTIKEGENLNDKLREKIISMMSEIISKKDKALGAKIFFEFFSKLYDSVNDNSKIIDIKNHLNSTLGFNGTTGSYYVSTIHDNSAYDETNINTNIITTLNNKIQELEFNNSDLDVVRLKIIIKYYDDLIKGNLNREHIQPLINRLDKRFEYLDKVIEVKKEDQAVSQTSNDKNNFTILSLKDVNPEMTKILPLLICKHLYDEKKKKNKKESYLNLIIDEAHNILSYSSSRESESWKDYRLETFEEIIKEGRKFGVFLTIASQRPSDISSTIISQLHNYFLHRLINNNDILAVEKTISYLDKVSFEYLPILPTGTCILAGLLAQVPVVLDVGTIEPKKHAPDNETMKLIKNWKD